MSPKGSSSSLKSNMHSTSKSKSGHKSRSSSSKNKLTSENLDKVQSDPSNLDKYRQKGESFERMALGMKSQRDVEKEMREWERKYGK